MFTIHKLGHDKQHRFHCKVKVHIQCSSQSSGLLKALFTLLPGRPVQSHTISASLGSIQPRCNQCAKTIRTSMSSARYSLYN
ncbi:hypothetical protein NP493_717g01059 [Ridgeia piscesae]|uniref:Uncharacterized protein n=1 Tax=Ridgeia piscesae TaxID=27915 RepID=A0AAD9KRR1_RIDPI|nr:hypothetical protein NP493_717g01059 [Ridgeia piscesae]